MSFSFITLYYAPAFEYLCLYIGSLDCDASLKIAKSLDSPLLLTFVNGYRNMNKQKVSLHRYWEDFEAATRNSPHSAETKKDFILQLSFGSLSDTAGMLLETLSFFPAEVPMLQKMFDRAIEHGGMEWMSSRGDQKDGYPKELHDAKKVLKERRREGIFNIRRQIQLGVLLANH